MKIATGLLSAYAMTLTATTAWLLLGGAGRNDPRVLNVERINIREPDGTLRLAISNHARIPGIVIAGREYAHPNRPEAGMIFYNDEGTENGGLVFDGGIRNGRPTNGGSLTFDRWRQDQTIQMTSTEDGDRREAALIVNDRPDIPMDIAAAPRVGAMPDGPARAAAIQAAGYAVAPRAYLGRSPDKAAQLALRDGRGRARLVMRVADDGAATIAFLDATGRTTKTIDAAR